MDKNKYFLNTALVVVVGISLIACVLVRTFMPAAILPELNVPNIAVLSLIALVVDYYVSGSTKRCYILSAVFAVLTFGILPYTAGFTTLMENVRVGVTGGIVFTVITWLYTSLIQRLVSGAMTRMAPVFTAFCLYLAVQCLTGIL